MRTGPLTQVRTVENRDTFIHHAAPSTCNALKNDVYLAVDSWYTDVHFTVGLSAIS